MFGNMLMSDGGGTTWNPLDKDSHVVLSNGNLTASSTYGGGASVRSTTSRNSGKRYVEITLDNASNSDMISTFGILVGTTTLAKGIGYGASDYGLFISGPSIRYKVNNNAATTVSLPFDGSAATTVQFAWDADGGDLWFGASNAWVGTGAPGAGAPPTFSGVSGDYFAGVDCGEGFNAATANFGASPFVYTPPTGFTAWDA